MNSLRVWPLAVLSLLAFATAPCVLAADDSAKADDEGWINMFDGKTLKGWKANENPEQWKVADGAIVAAGPRSHLFYVGDDPDNPSEFEGFRFKADVMTTPGSNSGMYFHVKWQDKGFPQTGFEAQVNNSHGDPVRTGSIYHLVKNFKAPAKDNEWFTQEIVVDAKKKNIKTYVDGELISDYTEPAGKTGALEVIDKGTFCLQAHDPKSTTYYKNLKVKPLD
jgi:hypothetical protein